MPKPTLKAVPSFETEAEQRAFWSAHDSSEYVDGPKALRVVLPELRSSTAAISMRLPVPPLTEMKRLAQEQDVPYQSLMKVYLAERVAQERRRRRRGAWSESRRQA